MSAESSVSQVASDAVSDVLSRRRRALLIVTFLLAYVVAAAIAAYVHETRADSRRLATKILAQGYAQRIQERLQTALVSTYVLASVVKQSGGRVQHFNDVAAELITLFPSVSALQLAPDGVIQECYPLQGNEAAIGHDLLADRKRNREAAVAITTQQLTLAGPFKLIQGGVGAVGRLPVFLTNERGDSHFWGFANALVRIPTLLDAAGLNTLAKAGYRYELWRIHPDSEQRDVFARSGDLAPVAPVEYVITVFGGRWILSLAPDEAEATAVDYAKILGLSLLVALAVTLLQQLALRALEPAARR
ncbi:MAG: CHASE domain-containing protein [Rhodocyclales bacterium]|nr:CHASE domain-containing protein [Rhodocyclales bacterium]